MEHDLYSWSLSYVTLSNDETSLSLCPCLKMGVIVVTNGEACLRNETAHAKCLDFVSIQGTWISQFLFLGDPKVPAPKYAKNFKSLHPTLCNQPSNSTFVGEY